MTKPPKKPECFVVMPITTPESLRPRYRDDAEHFYPHVYDCLLAPAIEKAEFKPIPPKTSGAEVIHAEIIKKLETTDLVLCDMSTLNANVFFELGIRTAVNKPVCLIVDEATGKPPFDTSLITTLPYDHRLDQWRIDQQITKLADHIKASAATTDNSLWRYFGITTAPARLADNASVADKMEVLTSTVESLQAELRQRRPKLHRAKRITYRSSKIDRITDTLSGVGFSVENLVSYTDGRLRIQVVEPLNHELALAIQRLINAQYDVDLQISGPKQGDLADIPE